MALEKNQPRTALIAGLAALAVVATVLLQFFLVSYFAQVHDDEVRLKSAGVRPVQLNRQRALDRQRLEHGAMPITQAMDMVAGAARPRGLSPENSTDYSALQGWGLRPTGWHAPPAPTLTPGPVPQAGAPVMQGGPSSETTTPAALPSAIAPTTAVVRPSAARIPAPPATPPTTEGAAAH